MLLVKGIIFIPRKIRNNGRCFPCVRWTWWMDSGTDLASPSERPQAGCRTKCLTTPLMFFGERAQDFQIQLFITIISASTELPFFFSKNRDHDNPPELLWAGVTADTEWARTKAYLPCTPGSRLGSLPSAHHIPEGSLPQVRSSLQWHDQFVTQEPSADSELSKTMNIKFSRARSLLYLFSFSIFLNKNMRWKLWLLLS